MQKNQLSSIKNASFAPSPLFFARLTAYHHLSCDNTFWWYRTSKSTLVKTNKNDFIFLTLRSARLRSPDPKLNQDLYKWSLPSHCSSLSLHSFAKGHFKSPKQLWVFLGGLDKLLPSSDIGDVGIQIFKKSSFLSKLPCALSTVLTCGGFNGLKTPLNIISVRRSSSALLNSQAIRPMI